jgi:hypothetical protein
VRLIDVQMIPRHNYSALPLCKSSCFF